MKRALFIAAFALRRVALPPSSAEAPGRSALVRATPAAPAPPADTCGVWMRCARAERLLLPDFLPRGDRIVILAAGHERDQGSRQNGGKLIA